MSKFKQIAVACCLFVFTACNKESIPADYTETPVSTIPTKQINAGVQGIVLDEKNQPVSGAAVSCGNGSAITDQNGVFLISKADMKEAAAVAFVKKDGYFNGFRTFKVSGAGKIQFVQIQLLPKKSAGTFDANKGGTITASNAQFTFTANQVLNASNQPYAGKATLIYAPINPEDVNFASQLPGDLRAVNSNNEEVGLKSYGMMALELQGENGEKLHLDGKQDVNFKMTIPAGLQASAPATIPLWHFDETDGLWKEEGKATKSGNSYVGTVKHFSFWNCDAQFSMVNFQATFQDVNGGSLGNMSVYITRPDGSSAYATTDIAGAVKGFVPSNEPLTITFYDKCKDVVYTSKIGPFTKDIDLGTVAVTLSTANILFIKGQLTACDDKPIANGVVTLKLEGLTYLANLQNGTYQVSILRCNNNEEEVTITGTDLDASKAATTTILASSGVVIRNLQACDQVQFGSFSLILGNKTYTYNSIADSMVMFDTPPYYTFSIDRKTGRQSVYWIMDNIGIGSHTPSILSIGIDNVYYSNPNVQVSITQTANKGDYIIGSLNGTITQPADSSSGIPAQQVPISGSFKILRQ
ncbi:hypothetical protein ACE38W_11815 [Chitinophaga sp. Hz27]|uniref:hypothetical protein n=1 Tax=Chitinophaga sp. Hz27 TaxID=3347169 RepID=UPI0035E02963